MIRNKLLSYGLAVLAASAVVMCAVVPPGSGTVKIIATKLKADPRAR